MKTLAVIGGGAWGTALSIVLAPRFPAVRLWVYEADLAARMAESRENDIYLAGCPLPPNVQVVNDLAECLDSADVVLGAMPSHLARSLYRRMLPNLTESMLLVSATKGLETGTMLRISEVMEAVVSERFTPRICVLSGPTFAREVASGSPTALVAASFHADVRRSIQKWFSGPTFRVYTGADPVGVEIGGAIKNVVALGSGVCAGLGIGHNSVAALVTRGLAEMTRLAVAAGGKSATLFGLAGLGDLVLTCTGDLSRNRQFGMELARGRKAAEIINSTRTVAEGVNTTAAAVELARRHGLDLPICEQMYGVLERDRSPREAIRLLMERKLKEE